MIINNKEYRINILILTMESQIQSTIGALEPLIESIEEGVIISVLLNGAHCPELKALFSPIECIRYYESKINLGVAGGRNFLLNTTESENSEIIMILDNDVITPQDYVRKLATFLIKEKDAGIVGAVAANINYLPYELTKHLGVRGKFGNQILKIDSDELKKYYLKDLIPLRLYHIGTHPNFKFSYFSIRGVFFRRINLLIRIIFEITGLMIFTVPELKKDCAHLQAIMNGAPKYPVSNVAGCSQAFWRKLVDEIGQYNEMFNPYGFEDANFCIRAIKSGYRNYIDTNTWLLHGTDTRHGERGYLSAHENWFRCLTILAHDTFPGNFKYKFVIIKLIIANFFSNLISMRFEKPKSSFRGFITGMKAIDGNIKKREN